VCRCCDIDDVGVEVVCEVWAENLYRSGAKRFVMGIYRWFE